MRRALAPYAIAAALVFVLSIAALAAALAAGGLLEERNAAVASPSPSVSRAPIELSRAGRLAYWRVDPNGDVQLWVSNLDGSGRRGIAKIDSLSPVSLMRWSPDGNALAYADRGQAVVVQRLDGSGARYDLRLPQLLIAANARITDLAWSTDSATLAATVVRLANADNPNTITDVFVAAITAGSWRRVTALGNAFLSQWISPDELLIHTQAGLIAIVRSDGTGLRPLTGMVATSPFVADDGRVYFFAGQVAPTIRDQTVPVVNAGQARVWSMTADGGDVRLESPQLYDDVRLVTRWPNGRFVVHQGASTALAFLANGQPPIDTSIGVVDRVVFSADRRTAIGLTTSRIYRYDVAQPDRPVVLLGDVTYPDAWYPKAVPALARSSPVLGQPRPALRYAFSLGGLLWVTDANSTVRLIRQLQSDDRGLRRFSGVAVPQWSPRGDRIAYFDVLEPGGSAGAIFVTDPTGSGGRISDAGAAGPFPVWTPDGYLAYTYLIGARDSATFAARGEVRVVSPFGGGRIATYPAREIAFGGGKTFLIDNGRPSATNQNGTTTDHALLEQTATGTRTVTTAAFLNAGLPFADVPGGATQTAFQLSMLGASADGQFLSARVSPAVGSIGFTFAILRASDGTPTFRFPGQAVADVRWSPSGPYVGMTLGDTAAVRDAGSGAITAFAGRGRFAGWSPDGKWFYVARDEGLYAIPLAGGGEVRISALGVPVATTTP